MKEHSRVRAEVSLDAVAHNFAEMRKCLAKGTQMVAVVKADAYGHGAAEIAGLIQDYSYIWGFAVATAEEALSLKASGVTKPILILGLVFPEEYEHLIREDIRLAVCDLATARGLNEEALRQKKQAYVHLAVDTGMNRIGYRADRESLPEVKLLASLPGICLEGVFTHFARADETDKSPAYAQLDRYLQYIRLLEQEGIHIPLHHCSNSAGILRLPEAHLHMVRAGITIYGIYPSMEVEREEVKLLPVMELKSCVSYVKTVGPGEAISYGGTFVTERETKVATIPVGYADGYPRMLSNKGYVLIHGRKARILGRICMDQFMVDVTEIPQVHPGDEVTLIGKDGEEEILVEELGELCGRFSYEFICGISKRVPRVYLHTSSKTVGE